MNSHARAVLYHVEQVKATAEDEAGLPASGNNKGVGMVPGESSGEIYPRYEDCIFLLNSDSMYWGPQSSKQAAEAGRGSYLADHVVGLQHATSFTEKVSIMDLNPLRTKGSWV